MKRRRHDLAPRLDWAPGAPQVVELQSDEQKAGGPMPQPVQLTPSGPPVPVLDLYPSDDLDNDLLTRVRQLEAQVAKLLTEREDRAGGN